jgi:biopolymer transport protein TolQ
MVQGIIAGASSLPVAMSWWTAFNQSGMFGKIIVMVLVLGSVFVWSIMLSKYIHLRSVERRSEAFLMEYRRAIHPMALFNSVKNSARDEFPLREIYYRACSVLGASLESSYHSAEDLFSDSSVPRINVDERTVDAVRSAADRSVADEVLNLEKQVGWLAIAASAAPFLGLLGTVSGVMDSFGSMASAGAALLSEVAPGISAALLTTVVGLIVALPSSIGYNVLSTHIRRLTVMMDNFAQELTCDIERMHS